jgi:VWFA-related protein
VSFVPVLLLASFATLQEPPFAERVEVERVLVDARVVDASGRPVLGLKPENFRVKVDGQPVPLESVQWISGETPYPEGLSPEAAQGAGLSPGPPGRLIVFFFQKDTSVSTRITGLMQIRSRALEFLKTLTPGDRVAILSYDSHLKLHLDFSPPGDRLRAVVSDAPRLGDPPLLASGPFPSLAAFLTLEDSRRASTPEEALLVTARALEKLPGAKSLILFGWGLGDWIAGVGGRMSSHYEAARQALSAARVTVFALDVTQADAHSLEFGLETVAEDTGGIYEKTFRTPDAAMAKLTNALAGYYLLAFEKPPLSRGRHRLQVDLVGRGGSVLFKGFFEGS